MPGESALPRTAPCRLTEAWTRTRPIALRSCSSVTAPGRSNSGTGRLKSTIVDSTPCSVGPPSRTASMRPRRSSTTCCASVGLGFPATFAEGAAMGQPAARINWSATGWSGMRTAAVLRRTSVNGPGQNFFISLRAEDGISATSLPSSLCRATCTMSGLSLGLRLALKILRQARAWKASAPRPYTVSVGKATRPPRRRIAAAFLMPASSGFSNKVRIPSAQKLLQGHGVVARYVFCAEQEHDHLMPFLQHFQISRPFLVLPQLGGILFPEGRPLGRVVGKPLAQRVGGRDFLQPLVDGSLFLCQAARTEPVNENPATVFFRRRLIHPFYPEHLIHSIYCIFPGARPSSWQRLRPVLFRSPTGQSRGRGCFPPSRCGPSGPPEGPLPLHPPPGFFPQTCRGFPPKTP